MRRLSPLLALLLALTVAPLAARTQAPAPPAAQSEPATPSQAALPDYAEARDKTPLRNDLIGNAEPVGDDAQFSWSQTVAGTIDSSADLDYFAFRVSRPASAVAITLAGPQADYDLVLGGGQDTSQGAGSAEDFQDGLEEITQIGGSIRSIGGSIRSIGGSIRSIGGSIRSIGGSIRSIGGSIRSISANAGTASETIEAQLWLPGTYYVVVTTANGEFSASPYTLDITLTDSGLTQAPPSPEVAFRLPPSADAPGNITTLYIWDSARMAQVYGLGEGSPQVASIETSLGRLANINTPVVNGAPLEKGLVVDLAGLRTATATQTMTDVYTLWDANKGNPLYANFVAGVIDNVIEAATTDGVSGPGASAELFVGPSSTLPLVTLPNLRNVVLVGGDEVVPFYRQADLAAIANEAEYAAYLRSINANGIIDRGSALGAALRYSMLLSDSVYGADKPYSFYGFPFFMPRLAVGRIVETPEQIAQYLDFYANGSPADFQIDVTSSGEPPFVTRAFVGGYDFLKDQAVAVGTVLRTAGLQPEEFNFLVNDEWGRPELEQEWFDGVLDTEFPAPPTQVALGSTANVDLSSVNAHFDHWQLLPANNPTGAAGATFPATRLLEPQYIEPPLYFGGTLGYSVGCHSGYSVSDGAIVLGGRAAAGPAQAYDPNVYRADFAQALNRHGGNWVGNTGYGYGTADGVDYSERLSVLYTQELVRETFNITGTQTYPSIGEALVGAKQRYIRNAASLSEYDYKAVSIMTLYGLPFVRVQVSNPLAPPAEDPTPERAAPLEIPAPIDASGTTGRLTRTITFTIDVDASDFKAVPRTGSMIFDLDPADFTVVDEFDQRGSFPTQAVRTFSNNQVGAPTLPTFAYDISAASSSSTGERLRVLDVVFVRGTYDNRPAFDPQVTQVATETLELTPIVSRTDEPSFEGGAGIWYPDKFFGFSSVGEGGQRRDQLTSFAAQFRADTEGETGLLRPYREMVFRVTYDDPSVDTPRSRALDADNEPPMISAVRIKAAAGPNALAQAPGSLIVVEATDAGPDTDGVGANQGLAEVSAVYIRNGTIWEPLELRETSAGSGVYTAFVPLRPGAARFIVRATDLAGNTSYYTAKGRFTPYATVRLPLVQR